MRTIGHLLAFCNAMPDYTDIFSDNFPGTSYNRHNATETSLKDVDEQIIRILLEYRTKTKHCFTKPYKLLGNLLVGRLEWNIDPFTEPTLSVELNQTREKRNHSEWLYCAQINPRLGAE